MMCIYDKDQMSALRIKNTSESDLDKERLMMTT